MDVGNQTTFLVGSLVDGTTYYFAVQAYNTAGALSAFSNEIWGAPGVLPPNVPSTPAPADGATSVAVAATLAWTAAGATSYEVRFGTTNPPPQVATGLSTSSFVPTGLTNSTTYFWQIIARNAGGITNGPVWSFTTVGLPPAAPSSPSPATGAAGVSITATLTWSAPGATGYDVRFGTTNPPPQVASGLSSASYTPSGMTNSTTYFWQVVARNTVGTTNGPVWSFTTVGPPPATPSSPSPASGATGTSTTASLTWTAAGATSYDVRFGTTNPPPQVTTGLSTASYAPGGLAYNTTYFWQIVARNSNGATTGPVWSFTTAGTPPAVPSSPSPGPGASGVGTMATLNWRATGATSYDVRFGTTNPPAQVATGLTTASYAPGAMTSSTTYFWQIIAQNSNGTTNGPVWSFTTISGSGTLLVQDTFTGADGTSLPAHLPDVNVPAAQWTLNGGTPMPALLGGLAAVSRGTGHLQVTLDSGVADVVVAAEYHVGSGPGMGGLAFRLTDANNYLLLETYSNALQFYRRQAGVYTLLGGTALPAPLAAGSIHRLEVHAIGSTLQGWWDGLLILQTTDSFQQSATRHGLDWNSAYDATTTYGNFQVVDASLGSAPVAPSTPSPASGATGVATTAMLTWSAAGATSYDVRLGTTNPPPQVATALSTASYAPGAMAANTTYFWQVVARNSAGTASGAVWSYTTSLGTPPAVPSSPSPADGATGIGTTATLTWSAAGATSYDVRFGTTNPPPQVATGLSAASYSPGGTTANTTYFWQVIARNTAGATNGPVWSFTTVAGIGGLLVQDTFTGPDGTSLLSHVPDVNLPAASWTLTGGIPTPTLVGGRVTVRTGSGHLQATLNTWVADVVIGVDYYVGAGRGMGGLAFRLADANNYLLLETYNNALQFYRRQAGAYTLLASGALPLLTAGSTHRLEVRATGSTLQGWWDGILLVQTVDMFQQTATRHGLNWNSAYDPTTAYGNFQIEDASNTPPVPSSPSPSVGAIGVATTPALMWSAPRATSYDVRFGTTNPPPPVMTGLSTASYSPGALSSGTTYFWQVVAYGTAGPGVGPVWSFTTAGSSTGMLVRDTFTGVDGTSLLAHLPELNVPAAAWTLTGGTPTPTLVGGRAAVGAGSGHLQVTLNSGAADIVMGVDYYVGAGRGMGGLAFRMTDANNYLLLETYANQLQIYRRQDGVYTLLASSPLPTLLAGSTHRLEVQTIGSTIQGWWDGVLTVQTTDAFQQSATRHGLNWNSAYDPAATYGDFQLWRHP